MSQIVPHIGERAPSLPEPDGATPVEFGRGFYSDVWFQAAFSHQLKPGTTRAITMAGQPVVLARGADGKAFALRDVCAHRAAALSPGRIVTAPDGAQALECPYHGWQFGANGACKAIPALPDGLGPAQANIRARAYLVHEEHGIIWIYAAADPRQKLEDIQPALAPPVLPAIAQGKPKLIVERNFAAQFDHVTVGLVDPAHTPYIHQQWFWRRPTGAKVKHKDFVPHPLGFTMQRHEPSSNSWIYNIFPQPTTEIVYTLPGIRWEHVVAGKTQFLTCSFLRPQSETHTSFVQAMWWNTPVMDALHPFFTMFAHRFLDQDGGVLANQAKGLALNPPLLWVGDADEQSKWLFALKKAWMQARQQGKPFENPIKPAKLSWRT